MYITSATSDGIGGGPGVRAVQKEELHLRS